MPAFPKADDAWAELRTRLDAEQPGWAGEPQPRFAWRNWAGWAAAAVVAVALIGFNLTKPAVVSANKLLLLATRAESSQGRNLASAVIHRKLRISRSQSGLKRSESLEWELWQPIGAARIRQRVHLVDGRLIDPHAGDALPVLFTELSEVLRRNRLDPERPLSVRDYSNCLRNVAGSDQVSPAILPGGDEGYSLSRRAGGNAQGLVESELLVRKKDWHAVAERLRVRDQDGDREFEIAESMYQVVQLASLASEVAAELTSRPSEDRRVDAATIHSPRVGARPTPDVFAAAIAAQAALHRVGACERGGIEIVPGDGRVEVRAAVASREDKDALLAALAGRRLAPAGRSGNTPTEHQ